MFFKTFVSDEILVLLSVGIAQSALQRFRSGLVELQVLTVALAFTFPNQTRHVNSESA